MWPLPSPERPGGESSSTIEVAGGPLLLAVLLAAPLRGGGFPAVETPATPAQTSAPAAAKPQPLPFSHKRHAGFFADCQDCHPLSSDGWTMSYPQEEKCMACHATIKADSPTIRQLAAFYAAKKHVPWIRIYEVPDYVYFSHRTHLKKAKLDCETCHGPVREREELTKEKPTSMPACIRCHKDKGAPVSCRTCHNSL